MGLTSSKPRGICLFPKRARRGSLVTFLDLHSVLINLVIPQLPLTAVLSLRQTCRALKTVVHMVSGAAWKAHLHRMLPSGHALLTGPAASFSPIRYLRTQGNIAAGSPSAQR